MWGHILCVEALETDGDDQTTHMSTRKRTGNCAYGDKCFFSHDLDAKGSSSVGMHVNKHAAPKSSSSPVSSSSSSSSRKHRPGGRPHLRNKSRSFVLRKFILDNFPPSCLSGTILDVAGGKGELSYEFCNLVPGLRDRTVLVDPRTCDLRKFRKKWSYGLYWRNPVFTERYNKAVVDEANRVENTDPYHARAYFDLELFDWAKDEDKNEDKDEILKRFVAIVDKAKNECWTNKGLRTVMETSTDTKVPWCTNTTKVNDNDDDDGTSSDEDEHGAGDYASSSDDESTNTMTTYTSANICSCSADRSLSAQTLENAERVKSLVKNATLLVGMHPDQAAGEIAQVGLKYNIPFAIVPCCVYSKTYNKRVLKDGTRVKTHADLCNWLVELGEENNSEVQRTTIDIEGKNEIIYFLGR